MTVTVTMVGSAIEAMFESKAQIDEEEDSVRFGIIANGFTGEFTIRIESLALEVDSGVSRLCILLNFEAAENEVLNLANKPYSEVLEIANELNLGLNFTSVFVYRPNENHVELLLHYAIRQSAEALQEALEQNLCSDLHWALHYMIEEFELLAPVVLGYANGNKMQVPHIKHLLAKTSDTAHA